MLDIFEERESLRAAAKTAKMRAGTMGLREGFPPHLKDVMDILYQVWEEIPAQKIKNCWTKSTLVSFDPQTNNDKDRACGCSGQQAKLLADHSINACAQAQNMVEAIVSCENSAASAEPGAARSPEF